MTQNNHSSKAFVPEGRNHNKVQPRLDRRECNCPVPLEAFDRERMGIAAKE